jgi:hypothetical protein
MTVVRVVDMRIDASLQWGELYPDYSSCADLENVPKVSRFRRCSANGFGQQHVQESSIMRVSNPEIK